MENHKKYLFFLCLCIPLRLFVSYLSKQLIMEENRNSLMSKMFVVFVFITSVAWMLLFLGVIKRENGFEAPNNKIWWSWLRPIHSFFYMLYVICFIFGIEKGWFFMAVDPLVGLFFSLVNKFGT